MIVTSSFSREMGEGGRVVGGPRVPTLGLPDHTASPAYKGGVGSAFDHNKNTLGEKEVGGVGMGHQLQPFTAPWLAQVAHITPAPHTDHLQYPQPPTPTLTDYYPHYPGLHRPTGYYPHHFLPPGAATHFLREYPRHGHRPYPPLERPTPVVRALGPPALRGLIERDPMLPQGKVRSRPPDLTLPTSPRGPPGEPSPRALPGEPSPRVPQGDPSPRGQGKPLLGAPQGTPHLGAQENLPLGAPMGNPALNAAQGLNAPRAAHRPTPTAPAASPRDTSPQDSRPPSPYHAHFARGALVTVGVGVRRVEELETEDFLEAAQAAQDLMLDPSTVAAINTSVSRPGATSITFTFPSRSTQVSVEASLDHPFFVFHSGWSSCSPELTHKKYDLKVRQLQVGDVCVSLTKKSPEADPPTPTLPPPAPTLPPAAPTLPPAAPTLPPAAPTLPPPLPASTIQLPAPTTEISSRVTATITTTADSATPGSTSVKDDPLLSFLGGTSNVWSKPAASRTTERQHSSDEAQKEEKECGRKRRWSDPGQAT
nr:LOW QUALITY PROTEIN: nascent polypeptide-associated complex subunit alpha, muscle-specific form-like [Cherax quadricarinatus]